MKPYEKIGECFDSLLVNHIATKTSYPLLHEHTKKAYELAFDCFHQIGERMMDLDLKDPLDDDEAVQQAYKDMEDLKQALYDMIKDNKSIGLDNLLRGLADRAEDICGDLKGFLATESDEYEKESPKQKGILPAPKK